MAESRTGERMLTFGTVNLSREGDIFYVVFATETRAAVPMSESAVLVWD